MKQTLINLTSGEPKKIIPSVIWATLESILRMMPAVIAFYGIMEIFNTYTEQRAIDLALFGKLAIASVVWFLIQLAVSMVAYDKEYTAAYTVSADGRRNLANHLRKLSLGYFDSRDPGDLTTMMLGDYALLENAVSHMLPQAFGSLLLLAVAFVSLGAIDWRMTLCIYGMLPLVLLAIWGSNVLMEKLGAKHIAAKVDSASRLQEYLHGIKEIKAYSLGGQQFGRLERAFNNLRKESIRIEGFLGPVVLMGISVLRMGLPVMIFAGAYFLGQNSLSVSVFLAFVVVAGRIYDPFTTLLINYTEMRYAMISGRRIMEIRNQPVVSGTEKLPADYTIRMENVSFAYNDETVLSAIDLTIAPKSMTALVGPSGSGKSTIVKLLARFYEVNEGRITIGGKDLQTIDPENLYDHLSMVFQDVYLFKDTILNNIRVGNQAASFEEVVAAAKQAHCHEFIMALPNGYDTMVGEGGSSLSGGEKQRISIARAFLKKSEIILLDEATAALDLENEAGVQKAIRNLVADKTVIVIAHRLKTVINADQIVVLEDGKIAGVGTHQSLYTDCSLYKKLVDMQNEAANWKFNRCDEEISAVS